MSHASRLSACVLTAISTSIGVILAPASFADHIEEVLIYDSRNNDDNQDEGLVRQRLGLLDVDGNPDPDGDNTLPALVSADGLKLAYDIGVGDSFAGGFGLLKGDGGVLTVLLHGRTGVIEIGAGNRYKGFGTGTGNGDGCVGAPYQLDGQGAHSNMTVHLVVCQAGGTATGITSVATTLRDEIVSLGGSVSTLNSTADNAQSIARRSWRKRGGATMSAADSAAARAALTTTLIGTTFKDKWKTLQQRLDAAVAPDGTGSRAIAVMRYIGRMGGVDIQKPAGESADFYDDVVSVCSDDCAVGVQPSTWSRVKAVYR